uniref:Uncharacterized protein n=1 Tax=Ignisphaera aggregans TaxID=334771 RepID=A0A7C5TJ74_9CREN
MRNRQPVVVEALKVRAVPEGSCDGLVEFLRLYRDAFQMVVNELWNLGERPSKKKLHEVFYGRLRRMGFRAHHVKEVYTYLR